MNKAIFLDRDGVLNNVVVEKNFTRPPYNKKELKICYENIRNINLLNKKYFFFIITNQPDIKRGKQTKEFNDYINRRILKLINIREITTCLCFEEEKDCNCYKPRPGMLEKINKKWKINFNQSFVIGDSWRDIEAGKAVGCKTIFLKKKYNLSDLTRINPNYIVRNLKNIDRIIS